MAGWVCDVRCSCWHVLLLGLVLSAVGRAHADGLYPAGTTGNFPQPAYLSGELPAATVNAGSGGPGADHCVKCLTIVYVTRVDDITRALLGVTSLLQHMPSTAVHELLMIVPLDDALILRRTFDGLTQPPQRPWPIRLVAENTLFNKTGEELDKDTDDGKYNLQMTLKLFASHAVQTQFYIVMDSDVVALRPISVLQLFPEPGKALYMPEKRSLHYKWYSGTEEFMGLKHVISGDGNATIFGVTPAILATDVARKAVDHIKQRFGRKYLRKITSDVRILGWTEYITYVIMATKFDLFNKYHALHTDPSMPVLMGGLFRRTPFTPEAAEERCGHALFCVIQSLKHIPVRTVARAFPQALNSVPLALAQ